MWSATWCWAPSTVSASATKKLYKGEVDIRVAIDPDSGAYETFRRWLSCPTRPVCRTLEAEELISDVAVHGLEWRPPLKPEDMASPEEIAALLAGRSPDVSGSASNGAQ